MFFIYLFLSYHTSRYILPCSQKTDKLIKKLMSHWTVPSFSLNMESYFFIGLYLPFFDYSISHFFEHCNMSFCKKLTICFCIKHRFWALLIKKSLQKILFVVLLICEGFEKVLIFCNLVLTAPKTFEAFGGCCYFAHMVNIIPIAVRIIKCAG